jgi:outer membrane biogenesis lipoprotein LolB
MLRATFLFFVILLLTGCENKQFKNPVVGQDQQIESPLQNTVEGMAKAKSPERGRLSNLQPVANPRGRNPLF